MEVTKPNEFIGFGAMEVTKLYEFINSKAGIGSKPTMSFGKWQSGPSPGTPRAKDTN